ncbi:hypothetical protein M0R45_013781 [Rubus argutus]|uniref:Uncharacterized protein n=1 Tax=Rubus argutus TaxID=59490 RepID=A0AAW1XMV0_RUBAR
MIDADMGSGIGEGSAVVKGLGSAAHEDWVTDNLSVNSSLAGIAASGSAAARERQAVASRETPWVSAARGTAGTGSMVRTEMETPALTGFSASASAAVKGSIRLGFGAGLGSRR